ncbi:MAG: hypothetical protein WC532_00350 [Candidatus Omnitrophota bacterium]
MKNKRVIPALVLLAALFFAQPAAAKEKPAADKRNKTFKSDLDADAKFEVIQVIPAVDLAGETQVKIAKRDRTEIGNFSVPGKFSRLEIIDLNEDGYKQMAVYCAGENGFTNLAVYNLKNGRLSKVFAAGSSYGIDTDFRSVLARIRVGRQCKVADRNSYTDIPEWDVWIWSGEKFIKQ